MTGQPLIYHPTADYKHTSTGLPRGFARPRRFHGLAGSLAPKPQQRATAWGVDVSRVITYNNNNNNNNNMYM